MLSMHKIMMAAIALLATGVTSLFAQTMHQSVFYPLNIGDRWTYRVLDLKAAPTSADSKKKVVVEVERQEPYTRKVEKDGKSATETKIGFILKSTSGGKTTRDHVVVLEDGVYRIHAAGTPITPPLLFFKLKDVKIGEMWDGKSVSGNTTIKGTFTLRQEGVTVPFRKVGDALFVSFTNNKAGEDRVEIDYWFVKDIGMVKQRVREKDREIVLELEKYEPKK